MQNVRYTDITWLLILRANQSAYQKHYSYLANLSTNI